MADPLTAADRSSLAAEIGPVNMAVGGLLLFEDGPGLRRDEVLERVEARLHLVPRYRQRVHSTAAGLGNPVWIDDDGFDLGWHVRRTVLPAPGGDAELAAFVGQEMARRLHRSRPLWELTVVEGMSDGRAGLFAKMHHALVDGIAAIDIGTVLLDPTPEPLAVAPPEDAWEPHAYHPARHLARLAATPIVRAQKLVLEGATRALAPDPRRAAGDLRSATELLAALAKSRPSAPMTPLNTSLSPNRRYAIQRAPLAAIKHAGKSRGATVNDALLAAVAGMLRRYLQRAGEPATRPLVALVPVSVRRPGEEGGNAISTVLVDLPVGEDDPARRIAHVHASMQAIKESAAIRAGALLVGAIGWAPPLVSAGLARATGGVRAFNLVVSNVPGPQQPFWLNGCRLLAIHPAVPLNPSTQSLNVGIVSYDGTVCFGLLADRDLDPPVEVAAACLREALDELTG